LGLGTVRATCCFVLAFSSWEQGVVFFFLEYVGFSFLWLHYQGNGLLLEV
jgi:hypothetical protein